MCARNHYILLMVPRVVRSGKFQSDMLSGKQQFVYRTYIIGTVQSGKLQFLYILIDRLMVPRPTCSGKFQSDMYSGKLQFLYILIDCLMVPRLICSGKFQSDMYSVKLQFGYTLIDGATLENSSMTYTCAKQLRCVRNDFVIV